MKKLKKGIVEHKAENRESTLKEECSYIEKIPEPDITERPGAEPHFYDDPDLEFLFEADESILDEDLEGEPVGLLDSKPYSIPTVESVESILEATPNRDKIRELRAEIERLENDKTRELRADKEEEPNE